MLALLLGGGYWCTRSASTVEDVVLNRIKRLLTGVELAQIRDQLQLEALSTGAIPGSGGDEELQGFLRENFKPSWGSRDSSLDLWGNPFRLQAGNRGDLTGLLWSTGPNGADDECALTDGESFAEDQSGFLQTGEGEAEQAAFQPDDICVSFDVQAEGDDSPFLKLDSR